MRSGCRRSPGEEVSRKSAKVAKSRRRKRKNLLCFFAPFAPLRETLPLPFHRCEYNQEFPRRDTNCPPVRGQVVWLPTCRSRSFDRDVPPRIAASIVPTSTLQ